MSTVGTVREWHDELGWGVVDAPELPGGCWVHFSSVRGAGYRTLTPGQKVRLESEQPGQDGYPFRAVSVWPQADDPTGPAGGVGQPHRPAQGPAPAVYGATLHIELDDQTGPAR